MGDEAQRLQDPGFRRLLARRSRWRWTLSGLLIGAYLLYAVAGIYYADAYAAPFLGSAVPWGMAIGYLIIALTIALSLVYVRVVNRIESSEREDERP